MENKKRMKHNSKLKKINGMSERKICSEESELNLPTVINENESYEMAFQMMEIISLIEMYDLKRW
jgi:hypothetical protein